MKTGLIVQNCPSRAMFALGSSNAQIFRELLYAVPATSAWLRS